MSIVIIITIRTIYMYYHSYYINRYKMFQLKIIEISLLNIHVVLEKIFYCVK